MHARAAGAAGQVPADPVIHGPESERSGRFDAAMFDDPGPLGGREVGIEHEPGASSNLRQIAGLGELEAPGGRPPVLPYDRAVQRAARRPVPSHSGLSLIGYPDRSRVDRPSGQLRLQLSQGCLDERPDLGGVVLDEPGSGEVLGELPVRDVDDLPVLVDGKGTHSCGTGIDRDHDSHGGTVVRAATAHSAGSSPPCDGKQMQTFASGR